MIFFALKRGVLSSRQSNNEIFSNFCVGNVIILKPTFALCCAQHGYGYMDFFGLDTNLKQLPSPAVPYDYFRKPAGSLTWHLQTIIIATILALTLGCESVVDELLPSNLTECDVCPEIVKIEATEFDMGRDGGEPKRYDGPVRRITFKNDFWISRREVSYAQFAAFTERSGYEPAPGCNVYIDGYWGWSDEANWKNPGLSVLPRASDPVVCVSWNDAVAYAAWVSEQTGKPYRLPTEAEWEFVARDGSTGEFAWDGGQNGGCDQANMFDLSGRDSKKDVPWPNAECDDGFSEVSPVGSLQPNSFGVYDILGNVWEWTQDCYILPYPSDGAVDGTSIEAAGKCERRTVRGGSWETRPDRFASSFRGRDDPTKAFRTFGIRLARNASE